MVSLCALQRQETGHQEIANMEIAAHSDCASEAIQFRQQQMGQIAESGQFSVQRFRSDAISGLCAPRNDFAAQRAHGTRQQGQRECNDEWIGDRQ